jgi:WD40 repeat protein
MLIHAGAAAMNRHRGRLCFVLGLVWLCLGGLSAAPVPPEARLAAEAEPPKDLYGDPLPDLAVARFGTVRWRDSQKGGRGFDDVVCSPDGKLVAGVGDVGLALWDAASGKPVEWFRPKTRPTIAAFSADGKTLVTGGTVQGRLEGGPGRPTQKYLLERWEVGTGKLLGEAEIDRPRGGVYRPRLSPDGKTLSSREDDKLVRLYDTTTAKITAELEANPDYSDTGIVWSPDGKTLAVLSRQLAPDQPGRLALYEAGTGKAIRTLGDKDVSYWLPAWAADGKRLAMVTHRSICVFDVDWGALVREIDGVRGTLAFSPDARFLASTDRATVHLFDTKTFQKVRTFDKPPERFGVPACWVDAKTLAFAGEHAVSLYDAETGKAVHHFAGHNGPVAALAFSTDGKWLASGDMISGEAFVWDIESAKTVHRFGGHPGGATVLAFSHDGKILAVGEGTFQTGAGERYIRLFDQEKGRLKQKIVAHVNNVASLSFAPDGRTLASAGGDGRWRLWDVATGRRLAQVREGEGPSFFVAFAPDGKSVLLGRPSELSVWKADLSEKLYDVGPAGQESRLIGYATFLPDSKTVISCERAKDRKPGDPLVTELLRWKGGAEQPERSDRLGAFQQVPYQFTLSPDGKSLAVLAGGYGSNRVEIWDLETVKVAAVLDAQPGGVTSVAFSPDGAKLATGSGDTTILLWDLPMARLERQWREWAGGKDVNAAALSKDADLAARFLRNRLVRMSYLEYKGRRPIADLGSDQAEVRQAAANALEKMGPEAEFPLRVALDGDPSPEVRYTIRTLLDGLGPARPDSAPWNMARLQVTLKCLEALGTPGAKKALQDTAEGPGELVVTKKAKEALERFGKSR